jgi:hypothetical protein
MYNTTTVPRAIERVDESRSRVIQERFPATYKPLTRMQYASHIVMFEGQYGVSLEKASTNDLLHYLRSLSSKGVKRRGIQALRAYMRVLAAEGARADDPMETVTISVVHLDPPSALSLRERLIHNGIPARRAGALTWGDLTLLSIRAHPFAEARPHARRLAALYLDEKIGGRRALRVLRARAARAVSDED